MLRKGVYPYYYIDDWEKFCETSLRWRGDIKSNLQARVSIDFEIKNLGEYHNLYVQSDNFLLADVFANFRNMWIKIYFLIFLLQLE